MGRIFKVEGLAIAGKTGTAQKVDHENHTYFSKRFVSSFVGFFPADDPRYLLIVVVDDPIKKYFGSTVAAPVFCEIAQQLIEIRPADFPTKLRQKVADDSPRSEMAHENPETILVPACLSLSEDMDSDTPMIEMPTVEGLPLRQAALELSSRGLDFQLNGSGIVFTQYPRPGDLVPIGYNCIVQASN